MIEEFGIRLVLISIFYKREENLLFCFSLSLLCVDKIGLWDSFVGEFNKQQSQGLERLGGVLMGEFGCDVSPKSILLDENIFKEIVFKSHGRSGR